MVPDTRDSVSAIITAYNCAPYLGQAIESVFNQSRPAQQVIVVDDGSTDNCADVVRAFGNRVEYHNQFNCGPGAARNAGIRLAQGVWLALLDGDDYWEPNKIARQLDAIKVDPSLEAVFAHIRQFVTPDLDPAQVGRLYVPPEAMPAHHASTALIRRDVFLRVGDFDEKYRISEFIDWYARAREAGLRERLLPDTLAWRRIHANNSTRRNHDRRIEYARVMKTILDRRRQSRHPDEPEL